MNDLLSCQGKRSGPPVDMANMCIPSVGQVCSVSYREIGQAVGFGKTKVGELINELKQEGQLRHQWNDHETHIHAAL